ncbi:MAG: hypothetical protein B6D36_02595 [Planctomycetes bacterium UTPLA1]|nr:MAG: hypothetical protein B6D36_02595 [Planctomycetes bacterium UTPLA1]
MGDEAAAELVVVDRSGSGGEGDRGGAKERGSRIAVWQRGMAERLFIMPRLHWARSSSFVACVMRS